MLTYLPETRKGRVLGLGIGVSAIGSGAFLGSSVLYFVGTVGFPAARVGLALSVAAVCGILSPVPVGRLADRVDPARLYLLLVVLRGLVYAGFALTGSYPVYLVLACVATALDRACSPLQQLVVARLAGDEGRTRALASVNSLRNGGSATGYLLASLTLGLGLGAAGFRGLFLFNAATYFVIASTLLRVRGGEARRAPAPGHGPLRDRRYMALAIGNGVMNVYQSVLFVLIPAWIAVARDLPAVVAPLLLGLNAGLAILTQVPAARLTRGRAPTRRAIVIATALLVAGSVTLTVAVLAGAPMWWVIALLGVAVVAFTLGESFQSVAAYELSFALAPPDRRGSYVAVFHASQYAQQTLGPAVMTAVLLPAGPGWSALAPVFVIGAAAMWWGSSPP